MMHRANPYQSPAATANAQDLAIASPERGSWRLVAAWAGAVLANTVLLLGFISRLGSFHCVWGVIAGITLIIASGAMVVRQDRAFGQTITIGGFAVALTQLVPLLHVAAGLVAIGVAQSGLDIDPEPDSNFLNFQLTPFRALIATVVTGLLIMGTGAIVGWVLSLSFHLFHRDYPGRSSMIEPNDSPSHK